MSRDRSQEPTRHDIEGYGFEFTHHDKHDGAAIYGHPKGYTLVHYGGNYSIHMGEWKFVTSETKRSIDTREQLAIVMNFLMFLNNDE